MIETEMATTANRRAPLMLNTSEAPKQAALRLVRQILARGFHPDGLYEYRAEDGTVIFWRLRLKHPQGQKIILPMRCTPSGSFELKEPEFPNGKPLYGLDKLAANPQAPVWSVEGEPKVRALAKLGVLATTSGGASSDTKADFGPLAGRAVSIWPDNDKAGIEHGERVAMTARALGCTVEMIDVSKLGIQEGGDVVDWLRAHPKATAADLATLPRIRERNAAERAPSAAAGVSEWLEPAPLPSELPPVEHFEMALLPDALRAWIADIAERTQCPPDFAAVGAMITAGSLIGRKIAIRPKLRDDWEELANLWGVIIGPPSVMKSTALHEALRPLRALEGRSQETHEAEVIAWRARQESAKVVREAARYKATQSARKGQHFDAAALLTQGLEEEPKARRYIANDATIPALCDVLRANPNGVLVHRDELSGLIRELDREGMEGSRSFYISAYSGKEAHTQDRIARGTNLRVPAVCLSMLGSMQPTIIGDLIRDAIRENGGDGFLSRFSLLVWPQIAGDWRDVDRWPDTDARQCARAAFGRLDTLTPEAVGAEQEEGRMPFLRPDETARERFADWREQHERRLRSAEDHPALIAHLGKYRKLVPALALICHLVDGGNGRVGDGAMLRALAWAQYLESHAKRAYASVEQLRVETARELLRRIERGDVPDPFSLRDVYLKGWSRLATPEATRQAADLLADLDWLRNETVPTTGRPKTIYHVNPRARR